MLPEEKVCPAAWPPENNLPFNLKLYWSYRGAINISYIVEDHQDSNNKKLSNEKAGSLPRGTSEDDSMSCEGPGAHLVGRIGNAPAEDVEIYRNCLEPCIRFRTPRLSTRTP